MGETKSRYIVTVKGYYYDEDDDCYKSVLINVFEFAKRRDADDLYNAIDLRNVFIAYKDCEFNYIECKLSHLLMGNLVFHISKYTKEFRKQC